MPLTRKSSRTQSEEKYNHLKNIFFCDLHWVPNHLLVLFRFFAHFCILFPLFLIKTRQKVEKHTKKYISTKEGGVWHYSDGQHIQGRILMAIRCYSTMSIKINIHFHKRTLHLCFYILNLLLKCQNIFWQFVT